MNVFGQFYRSIMQSALADIRSDPCLIISVLALLVLIPVGFTVDKHKLELKCAKSPVLHLHDDMLGNIPEPYRQFIDSARKEINIAFSHWYPTYGDLNDYVTLLKHAHERGVIVRVVTNIKTLTDSLSFADLTVVNTSTDQSMFVFFGQADLKRTIYASNLFTAPSDVFSGGEFVIDFEDCSSIANDVKSIFEMLQYYGRNGYPEMFYKKWVPGSTFPQLHHLPDGGDVVIGISPPYLTPPGREQLANMISECFANYGGELNLLTESLIPRTESAGTVMPELLLSERIELAALNNTKIRILLRESEVKRIENEVRSLIQSPNTEVRTVKTSTHFPTFYVYENEAAFMPLPFEDIVAGDPITLAMKMHDKSIADKLSKHFEEIWAQGTPFT